MKLMDFKALTFDCYGTLIDWETGILGGLRPMFISRGLQVDDGKILETYAVAESQAETGEFKPYREVLQQVVRDVGKAFGFEPTREEQESLPESVKQWQPFPDTVAALERLHRKYKLAIISNIDDDLFRETEKHLKTKFDFVTTALEVGSYKPSQNNFLSALRKMQIEKKRVLHVAQSLHHDIAAARALGISCVWVNRRKGKHGGGATIPSAAQPDLEVADLKSLADLCGC